MNYTEIREQRRADRAAERTANRHDRATERAEARADREQRRQQTLDDRARRLAALKRGASWVGQHPIDLLMSVIVVVPALLAWTAMSVYGVEIYGGVGALFPLFSEGAMWAFAFAAGRARREGRPVWMLLVGLWLFAAIAAGINWIHGSEVSLRVGVIMALVSVSGVIAHQIHMTADRTRRTRTEKRQAARERLAARRSHRMGMAASRQAVGDVAEDGSVRLLVQPGTVSLHRSRLLPWRFRVRYDAVPGVGADGPTEASVSVADEVEQWLSTGPERPVPEADSDPVPAEGDPAGDLQKERVPEVEGNAPSRGRPWDELVAAFWDEVHAGTVNPTSQRNVRERLRCSRDRARDLVRLYEDQDSNGNGPVPAR